MQTNDVAFFSNNSVIVLDWWNTSRLNESLFASGVYFDAPNVGDEKETCSTITALQPTLNSMLLLQLNNIIINVPQWEISTWGLAAAVGVIGAALVAVIVVLIRRKLSADGRNSEPLVEYGTINRSV